MARIHPHFQILYNVGGAKLTLLQLECARKLGSEVFEPGCKVK